MHTLTLDVCFDTNIDAALGDLTLGIDVETRLTGVKIGGGWPEVAFAGSREDLVTLATRYVGEDTIDLSYVVSQIA